jgi:hypothetical protein
MLRVTAQTQANLPTAVSVRADVRADVRAGAVAAGAVEAVVSGVESAVSALHQVSKRRCLRRLPKLRPWRIRPRPYP